MPNRWRNGAAKEWDQRPHYIDAAVQTDPEYKPEIALESQKELTSRVEIPRLLGNMQAYFRSRDYQLGDFFRPMYAGFRVELSSDVDIRDANLPKARRLAALRP